ncbi:MAG: transcription antitermination factor NusB [Clostridiales bacterium]|nr:transcription antitermination factor NusB [Clostridiales bacterium]
MARTTARAAVMQMIFENLAGGEGGEDTLQMVYEALRKEGVPGVAEIGEKEPNKSDRAYITRVLDGVLNNLEELDAEIQAASPRWNISRMPKVDLTILRLAAWEILHEEDVPGSVAINEAVNLATRYSEPTSGRFINGVLGTILRKKEAAQ